MTKETEIIKIIGRAKTRLEKSLNFYEKNKNNENIINHFWLNIGPEINDIKNELMDLEIELIAYLLKRDKDGINVYLEK